MFNFKLPLEANTPDDQMIIICGSVTIISTSLTVLIMWCIYCSRGSCTGETESEREAADAACRALEEDPDKVEEALKEGEEEKAVPGSEKAKSDKPSDLDKKKPEDKPKSKSKKKSETSVEMTPENMARLKEEQIKKNAKLKKEAASMGAAAEPSPSAEHPTTDDGAKSTPAVPAKEQVAKNKDPLIHWPKVDDAGAVSDPKVFKLWKKRFSKAADGIDVWKGIRECYYLHKTHGLTYGEINAFANYGVLPPGKSEAEYVKEVKKFSKTNYEQIVPVSFGHPGIEKHKKLYKAGGALPSGEVTQRTSQMDNLKSVERPQVEAKSKVEKSGYGFSQAIPPDPSKIEILSREQVRVNPAFNVERKTAAEKPADKKKKKQSLEKQADSDILNQALVVPKVLSKQLEKDKTQTEDEEGEKTKVMAVHGDRGRVRRSKNKKSRTRTSTSEENVE